jgi:tape measure domain-containing protein
MSTSIDQRVVQMRFDNSQFEQNMSVTQRSLQKLKDALNFSQSKQNIAELQSAGNNFNMSPMGASIDGISTKFLALSTIAITALSNIVNKAVDSGIQLGKSLTLAPIMQGFEEYELNMNSIQTILANTKAKGSTLEDVNKALDELNHYSDQTIYNFSEMARNIGTFTAAGVGLDQSVNAIKGIANLAAISGSNSQQASTAMYQLSQALAAGKVNLMDWNSVVNAGMGGEVFKKALFETGKAMGTITDVPLSASFEEWEKKGGTFREQMQKGWLTADVLSTTLEAFSGNLDEAGLKALGFSDAAAKEMIALGELGLESATKVKTFTQLMDTLKEGVASGWAQTWRTVFGDFEEARNLFSTLGGYFGDIVGKSAISRNKMLEGWKAFGGREVLMQGLLHALDAVETAIKPIREGFRQIFPRQTSKSLIEATVTLRDFLKNLKMGDGTVAKLKNVFQGFFGAIEIGWHILKGFGGIILGLFRGLGSGVGGGALTTLSNFGAAISDLNMRLVHGGGIANFFRTIQEAVAEFGNKINLGEKLDKIGDAIERFKNAIKKLFTGGEGKAFKGIEDSAGRVSQRLQGLAAIGDFLARAWDKLVGIFQKVGTALSGVASMIGAELGQMWDRIAAGMESGDFNKILDIVNVGLLGGIAALMWKFVNGGIGIDFGGGLLEGVKESFGALTDHLTAMQTNVKADTLMKIAKAIGILTASVLVLSLIDSGALTKALTAMAVGFGQLIATMALLTGMGISVKLPLLAASLILVSGSVLILGLAVRSLANLSWGELAKGLTGVAGLLAAISLAAIPLSANTGGMIRAGAGMIGISIAIGILSLAVKSFAKMDWGTMLRGLAGVAISLAAVTLAMNLMPKLKVSDGLAIIGIAVALNIMAIAVKQFGNMDIETLRQGLIGVGIALGIIALATLLFPPTLPLVAAGLILIGGALLVMTAAIKTLGGMDLGKMIQGIAGIAAVLAVLAIAAYAMSGALPGAAAMIVMSGALWVLSEVLMKLAKLKLSELGIGLLAIVGVLGALGLMGAVLSPLIPAMLGLGAAMIILGAGFALLGAGAYLVAKAFEAFAAAGRAGITVFTALLEVVIKKIPEILASFAEGIITAVTKILEAAPALVRAIVELASELLEGLTTLIPQLATFIGTLIEEFATLITEKAPIIIETGISLLMTFLDGIISALPELVNKVADIITAFLLGLAKNIDQIIWAGVILILRLIDGISGAFSLIVTAGGDAIVEFLSGIGKEALKVMKAGADLVILLAKGFATNISRIITSGVLLFSAFLKGLNQNIDYLTQATLKFILVFLKNMRENIELYAPLIRKEGARLALAIVDGFTGGMGSKTKEMIKSVTNPIGDAIDAGKKLLGMNSPSKVFRAIGSGVALGFTQGMDRGADSISKSAEGMATNAITGIKDSLKKASFAVDGLDEFNPTITPVLDLTKVKQDAGNIGAMLAGPELVAGVSYDQAASIFATQAFRRNETPTPERSEPGELKFEQHNHSPEALSTNDIYRQTRNLIDLAKEELKVP